MGIVARRRRTLARLGAIPIVVGAALSTGSFQPTAVHASAPQTLQRATFLGTGTLGGSGSAGTTDGLHDATAGDPGNAIATRGTDTAGTGTPNPAGRPVTTTGKFTGFSGITHADQRLAGTGKYANTQFSLEPPDQGLCVGGGFVLESVNDAFRVFDKAGNALGPVTAFNQFFGVSPAVIRSTPPVRGDFLSDPKCNYDVATQRWIMSILEVDAPGLCLVGPFNSQVPCSRAHTFLAVSQGSSPLGSWNLFSIDATDDGQNGTPNNSTPGITCQCFGDQPLLGVNADAVFISTNEYGVATATNTDPGNPEIGGQIYAISKRALENAGSGNLPLVVHINAGSLPMPATDCCAPWDSIQPATSPTAASQSRGQGFFLSSFTNNPAISHAINVWTLTGTGTLQSAHPDVDLQRVQLASESYAYDQPFGKPGLGSIVIDQKEGPRPLADFLFAAGVTPRPPLPQVNANDVRMNQVVYADGKLWGGLNTAVVPGSGGAARSAIAYFVVEPDSEEGRLAAHLVRQGYVSVAGESTLFPSIGVNQDGNGAIAFSVIGPDIYPSAAYVRINSDGRLQGKIVISGQGTGPDDGFTGYTAETGLPPVGRWGDYSAAVATPDGSIWMAAEYIPNAPRTLLANWGTFITHVAGD